MRRNLFILVLAIQSVLLLGMTFMQERVLASGVTVLLETRPVDPRDLLRGDFVILNYTISDVPTKLFVPVPTAGTVGIGRTVYVVLARRGEFHEVVRAGVERLTTQGDEVLIQGRVYRVASFGQQETVRIHYGLERYYVREGTGNPRGKLTVQAAVSSAGDAAIREVFVDGKPYAEVMKGDAR